MGNSSTKLRRIPEYILRHQSPNLTLIEFEQIYDEYIILCGNNQNKLENEHVYIHMLQKSIFLDEVEKQAIINEEFGAYLSQIRANQVFEIAEQDEPNSPAEEQKQLESGSQSQQQLLSQGQPVAEPSVDKDWVDLGADANLKQQAQLLGNDGGVPFQRQDSVRSHGSQHPHQVNAEGGIVSSLFCGCAGQAPSDSQSQFVTYARPITKRGGQQSDRQPINVSYIQDPQGQVGCNLGAAISSDDPTVHLTFADFSELLTYKLLRQLEMMEDNTVVEANSQNVSCFFWQSQDMQRQSANQTDAQPQYQLSEFRQSIPLQKQQSQARALVPITEADSDQETSHVFLSQHRTSQVGISQISQQVN